MLLLFSGVSDKAAVHAMLHLASKGDKSNLLPLTAEERRGCEQACCQHTYPIHTRNRDWHTLSSADQSPECVVLQHTKPQCLN